MANQNSPGIKTTERVPGFVALQGVATDFAGLEGVTERGPVNKATLITSLEQFFRIFGGPISNSYMFENVKGFFDNGGQTLYVVRVLHYTDINNEGTITGVKAATTLQTTAAVAVAGSITGTNVEPFDLEPGDDLDIQIDAGGTLTATFNATRATRAGAGATYAALNGLTLILAIDGGAQQTVTFTASETDAATTSAKINSSIVGGFSAVNAGEVDISSDTRGTGSSVEIVGGTALAAIGHTTGTTSGTGNVVNIDAVTAAEAITIIEAAVAGSTTTSVGGAIRITSDTTGASSSVQVLASSTADAVFGFDNAVHSGSASSAQNTLIVRRAHYGAFGNKSRVVPTRSDRVVTTTAETIPASAITELDLTSTTRLNVGDQISITDGVTTIRMYITNIDGNTIQFASVVPSGVIASGEDVVLETFSLQFLENGSEVVGAFYSDLRMSPLAGLNYVENALNKPDNPEFFFEAEDQGLTPGPTTDPRPDTIATPGQALTGGSDGGAIVDADFVGSSISKLGIYAYTGTPINMFAIPGQATPTVHQGIETYISTFRDTLVAVVTPPIGTAPTSVVSYFQVTANIADDNFYPVFPWIKVVDQLNGGLVIVPPDGIVLGLLARVVRNRNIAKAPAGDLDGRMTGVQDVEFAVDDTTYGTIYPNNINAILAEQGLGVRLFGSRTLGFGPADLKQISKRRTMNYVIDTIKRGTRFILFEGNDTESRALWRRAVQGFLLGLWKEKILDGKTANDAFFVICDESNNPPTVVQAGKFKGRIGLHFKNTIEKAEYEFEEDTRAIQEELASAGLT